MMTGREGGHLLSGLLAFSLSLKGKEDGEEEEEGEMLNTDAELGNFGGYFPW